MQTRIIHDPGDLNALSSAWKGLEQNAVLPMQQFAWSKACASAFTQDGELHVIAIEENGTLRAAVPLVRRRDNAYFELLGVAELHEPTDAAYADVNALNALTVAVMDLRVPLFLQRIPADSLFVKAMKNAFRGRGVLVCTPDCPWSWTSLDSRWTEPENLLNAKHRADFHRKQRLAREMGTVSFEVISPTPETLQRCLEEAFAVEASSWKGESKTAMALDPLRGPFHRCYAEAACERGILRLCFLRIDGHAAAMQFALEFGGRFWLLKIGYDNHFSRCSPGLLLLRETLRYAALRGLNSFEMLGTIDPRTQMWVPLERPTVTARGYPFGLRGMATLAGDVMKTATHKLRRIGQESLACL